MMQSALKMMQNPQMMEHMKVMMKDPAVKERMKRMLQKLGPSAAIGGGAAATDDEAIEAIWERMQAALADPERLQKLSETASSEQFQSRMKQLAEDPEFASWFSTSRSSSSSLLGDARGGLARFSAMSTLARWASVSCAGSKRSWVRATDSVRRWVARSWRTYACFTRRGPSALRRCSVPPAC